MRVSVTVLTRTLGFIAMQQGGDRFLPTFKIDKTNKCVSQIALKRTMTKSTPL